MKALRYFTIASLAISGFVVGTAVTRLSYNDGNSMTHILLVIGLIGGFMSFMGLAFEEVKSKKETESSEVR